MKAQFAFTFTLAMLAAAESSAMSFPAQPLFLNVPSEFDGQHVIPARAIPTSSKTDCLKLLRSLKLSPQQLLYLSCSDRPIYSTSMHHVGAH